MDHMLTDMAATEQERAMLRTRATESFRAVAQERIAADGAIHITKDTGAFVAR